MLKYQEVPNILVNQTLNSTNKSGKDTTYVTLTVEGYETSVMLLLSQLRWTWTGWALLTAIFYRSGQNMVIQPWTRIDDFNATASPTDFAGATPKGKPGLSCANPGAPVPGVTGSGVGSPSVVRFTPDMWNTGKQPNPFGTGPGLSPKEILLHEMVHGYRQMAATFQCAATPDQPGYDTVEEFMAILISNMFRSEQKQAGLRADHAGFKALPAAQVDPAGFLAFGQNKTRALQLAAEHPQLVANLKKVPAAFNPMKLV